MEDWSHGCPDCGGSHGTHFDGCIYEGTDSGNSSLGGSGTDRFIFAIFCVVGVICAVIFPPLGAGIILLGAKITGV